MGKPAWHQWGINLLENEIFVLRITRFVFIDVDCPSHKSEELPTLALLPAVKGYIVC